MSFWFSKKDGQRRYMYSVGCLVPVILPLLFLLLALVMATIRGCLR